MKRQLTILGIAFLLVLQAGGVAISGEKASANEVVLASYEQVRAELAKDQFQGAVEAAEKLQAAAERAQPHAAGKVRDALKQIASSAKELTAQGDLKATRT